jgi:hypothetical protein
LSGIPGLGRTALISRWRGTARRRGTLCPPALERATVRRLRGAVGRLLDAEALRRAGWWQAAVGGLRTAGDRGLVALLRGGGLIVIVVVMWA